MSKQPDGKPDSYIVRTRELNAGNAIPIKHPLNPNSDLRLHLLSERVGMKRMHLSLGRIPSGRESFVPHAHDSQEEYLFVLDGSGEVEINGERAPVGPGDYIGFPTDGAVHHLINTGGGDLVYLMGGERTSVEVCRFPTLGKIGIWENDAMRYVDESAGERLAPADFVKAPDPADDGN